MNMRAAGWFPVVVAGALVLSAAPLTAADEGKVEIAGYGGVSWLSGGDSAHGMGGGTAGVNIGRMLQIFGEGSYIPMGSASLTASGPGGAVHASATARLLSFGGGIHIKIPASSKAQPYALAAVGYGHQSASGSASGSSWGTPVSASVSMSQGNAYGGFGGGSRYFIGKSWGLRPEFRYQNYFGDGGGGLIIASAGVFVQFGRAQ